MNHDIPKNRQLLFKIGTVSCVIGVILFLSSFFTFFLSDLPLMFITAPLGMILLIIGSILREIGSRGLAGSGLILNPKQARDDLKPHSQALGGVINDVISEVKIIEKEIIKIRCHDCRSLNDESDKYCSNCGKEL